MVGTTTCSIVSLASDCPTSRCTTGAPAQSTGACWTRPTLGVCHGAVCSGSASSEPASRGRTQPQQVLPPQPPGCRCPHQMTYRCACPYRPTVVLLRTGPVQGGECSKGWTQERLKPAADYQLGWLGHPQGRLENADSLATTAADLAGLQTQLGGELEVDRIAAAYSLAAGKKTIDLPCVLLLVSFNLLSIIQRTIVQKIVGSFLAVRAADDGDRAAVLGALCNAVWSRAEGVRRAAVYGLAASGGAAAGAALRLLADPRAAGHLALREKLIYAVGEVTLVCLVTAN